MFCRIMNEMKKENVQVVIPRQTDDDRQFMKKSPVLRLTSTYVKAGEAALPKTGDRGPWKPRSYYFKDISQAWFGDIKAGVEWI